MRCVIIPSLETKLCGRELSSWQKSEEAAAGVKELRWQIQRSLLPAAPPASCSHNRACKGDGKSYCLITQGPCLHLHTPSTEKQTGDRPALAGAGGQAGDEHLDAGGALWEERSLTVQGLLIPSPLLSSALTHQHPAG